MRTSRTGSDGETCCREPVARGAAFRLTSGPARVELYGAGADEAAGAGGGGWAWPAERLPALLLPAA
jgi:hypothetical protein